MLYANIFLIPILRLVPCMFHVFRNKFRQNFVSNFWEVKQARYFSQVLQFSTIHIQLHIEQRPSENNHRNSSIARKKIKRIKPSEIMLAKVSFFIVFVFIICHSVRWIPNIYELIQRIHTKDGKIMLKRMCKSTLW